MRTEKYTVHGRDAYGNRVTEEIEVPRYNVFERVARWVRQALRRPRYVTSIRLIDT